MQPQLQGLEGLFGDDEFAVEDEAVGLQPGQSGGHLGEKAAQRFLVLGLQIDAIAVAEGETAKAVIFRLVEPTLAARKAIDRFGFHRPCGEQWQQQWPPRIISAVGTMLLTANAPGVLPEIGGRRTAEAGRIEPGRKENPTTKILR